MSQMDLIQELTLLKAQLTVERQNHNNKSLIEFTANESCNLIGNIGRLKLKTRCKLKGHASKIYALYWAHIPYCNNLLSASQDSTLILWDTVNRFKLRAIDLNCAWTMTCALGTQPSLSTDICASAGMDDLVSIYSLADKNCTDSGRLVRELSGHEGFISSIDFIEDSNKLISVSADCTCRVWDVNRGINLSILKGHKSEIYCMAVQDSNCFVTGSADHSIKLWDIRTAHVEVTIPDIHTADVNSITFFPNGQALASGSDDCTVKLSDLRAAQSLSSFSVPRPNAVQNDNAQRQSMPVCFKELQPLSDNPSQSLSTGNLCDTSEAKHSSVPITSVDFSSSGRLLFCGCDNFECVAFDTLKGTLLAWLHGHENRIQCTCVDRQGIALATGSWDSTVRIWN